MWAVLEGPGRSVRGSHSRITRKIASSLARELKEVMEKVEQERITVAVQRHFHLDTAPQKKPASSSNRE
jgi:hypothetical protein